MNTHPLARAFLGLALAASASLAQEAPASQPAPASRSSLEALPAAPTPPPARTDGLLRFNFRNAPLELVLNYMSDAAGFVIVLETPVRGNVDMWSAQPVTKDEAVQLLNLALNKNGYTASQQGKNLVITTKDDAKKRNIPIRTGNDPKDIPANAEMVMQIVPLRRIDAVSVARDLQTMIPPSATLTANQDSNSLVITDTQINVRHIVEIVAALDNSVDTVSTMRVFHLTNADPSEMAQLINNLFITPTTGTMTQGQGAAGGRAGMLGAMFGGGFPGLAGAGGQRGNTATSSQNRRVGSVVAIADPRTYSVIVTASKEVMPSVADVVAQLDSNSGRKQKVFVYTMENANVREVETILKNLFQSTNSRTSTSTGSDPLTTRANNASSSRSTTSGSSSGMTGNRSLGN
jgi:general secretion pathway protein D